MIDRAARDELITHIEKLRRGEIEFQTLPALASRRVKDKGVSVILEAVTDDGMFSALPVRPGRWTREDQREMLAPYLERCILFLKTDLDPAPESLMSQWINAIWRVLLMLTVASGIILSGASHFGFSMDNFLVGFGLFWIPPAIFAVFWIVLYVISLPSQLIHIIRVRVFRQDLTSQYLRAFERDPSPFRSKEELEQARHHFAPVKDHTTATPEQP